MPGRGEVFLAENQEDEPGGAVIFLGTFSGYHDAGPDGIVGEISDLSAEEAIAWGRARASRVWIRLGESDYFDASEVPVEGEPRWPPPELPELTRRRPPGQEWRDRPEDAEPIRWRVTLHLIPSELVRSPSFDATVEGIAIQAGAEWTADSMEAALAEIHRQDLAGEGRSGWVTYHRPGYRLTMQVTAPTARAARRAALDLVSAPAGWRVDPDIETLPCT
jgi:hypothetical protein